MTMRRVAGLCSLSLCAIGNAVPIRMISPSVSVSHGSRSFGHVLRVGTRYLDYEGSELSVSTVSVISFRR